MTQYLYDQRGNAVGFIRGRHIHDMQGNPIGQIHGTHVHKLSGPYVGELYEDMVVAAIWGTTETWVIVAIPATPVHQEIPVTEEGSIMAIQTSSENLPDKAGNAKR